jgi:hypothetical protein
MDDLDNIIRRHIRDYGRHIQGVFPCQPGAGAAAHFSYSIGNALVGKPELIVIGIPMQQAGLIINVTSEKITPATKPGLLDIDFTFPVYLRDVTSDVIKDDYTIQAGQFFRSETYTVFQVLYTDAAGHFPHDRGCDPQYRERQRIAGLDQ